MSEDAGKKRFIRDFLQRIKVGDGFYDDMRIERVIRLPGAAGEGSTARSLSGNPIGTITELLEDDLRHSFDNGYFTFRLVNAHLGSGKTTLLSYLNELAKTKQTYSDFSIVSFFRLSNIQTIGGSQCFSLKFYSYILGQTFWELINSSIPKIKSTAKSILDDYLEVSEINSLMAVTSSSPFCSKFRKYISESGIVFEELFFEIIFKISQVEPRFTFAYLIDDLDHLKDFPEEFKETRTLIKALVRRAYQKFDSKIRLLIYLAGTSENVVKFIGDDPVIESLVGNQIIVLNKGYENEFELIKTKIDGRIEGAFKGYKNFDIAWKEIESIAIDPAQNLRSFYRNYVTAILEIYEKYFSEEPEKSFEGNARDLIEAQCREKWQNYLNKKSYSLSAVSTTTVLKGHSFDCYVELLHNGKCVARCFGEAKNYELLSSHLEIFEQWLKDVDFNTSNAFSHPPELAFMIAPSCPSLLQRKLEIREIYFVPASKIVSPKIVSSLDPSPSSTLPIVNLNTSGKKSIVLVLKGTRIQEKTIDKILKSRDSKKYKDLDELCSDLNLTLNAKRKLQEKLDEGKICFM